MFVARPLLLTCCQRVCWLLSQCIM